MIFFGLLYKKYHQSIIKVSSKYHDFQLFFTNHLVFILLLMVSIKSGTKNKESDKFMRNVPRSLAQFCPKP